MLKKTVAGAALMAAALAMSAPPAFAHTAPGAAAVKTQTVTENTVQPVYYRRGGFVVRRPFGWGYRPWGGWGTPYAYGGYYPGYYGGWGYPAGYWGGYGWGPGVSVGIAPGFGIGFGF